MITLTEADLCQTITQADIAKLTAKQVSEGGNPVQAAIDDALDTVKMYVDPLVVPDHALRKVWRVLAVNQLYIGVSVLPEKRKDEQAWAIKVLEQIRDGKFPNLAVDPDLLPAADETDEGETLAGQTAWGSREDSDSFRIA